MISEFDYKSTSSACVSTVNQILYGRWFSFLYFAMMLLNTASLMFVIMEQQGTLDAPLLFITLEFLIITTFSIEMFLRLVSLGKKFWILWSNILDFSLLILCFLTCFAYLGNNAYYRAEEIASLILLVRYVMHFMRLLSFLNSYVFLF
eukprot:TRINITY_DN1068_c1_g1_i2.p1 TRINITY_DN1068_c1_g1~~TRINITY_DN1068_c1_g1_i2.p1  ORF type:complete len:148 (+),score=13.69 TRINITY_DN1068_c1_g1_i2:125-568(+)